MAGPISVGSTMQQLQGVFLPFSVRAFIIITVYSFKGQNNWVLKWDFTGLSPYCILDLYQKEKARV
jgi:hypothetical protein